MKLYPREREILGLIRDGLTDAEIARRLGISVHTVRSHLRDAKERNNVYRRVTLAMMAIGGDE